LRLPRGRLRRLAAGSPPPAVHRDSATADTSSPPPADQRDRKSPSGRARLLNLITYVENDVFQFISTEAIMHTYQGFHNRKGLLP
jgi:hypothetical protein